MLRKLCARDAGCRPPTSHYLFTWVDLDLEFSPFCPYVMSSQTDRLKQAKSTSPTLNIYVFLTS